MNEAMRTRLGQVDPADFARGETLSVRLSRLIGQGFIALGQAIVFAAMRKIAKSVTAENFPDLTGFECFVNHIHIEDQLKDGDRFELLKQGIAFGLALEKQLGCTFPDKAFKVIIAATAQRCGVRFHLVRPGEEWLASNLEGYRGEAILVLNDTPMSSSRR